MCNRFSLDTTKPTDHSLKWVDTFFDPLVFGNFWNSHNPFLRSEYKPTDRILNILHEQSSVIARFSQWGVKPNWSNKPITHSRSENLFTSPFWRPFISKNRCLIPATSFYEWQEISGKKEKKRIRFTDPSTCLAGLFGFWDDVGIKKEGSWVTLLTQEGNPLMKAIHNSGENKGRQPVVMREKHWEKWLNPLVSNEREIVSMIEQFSEEEITVEGNDFLISVDGSSQSA